MIFCFLRVQAVCSPGYRDIGGICYKCPQYSTLEPDNKTCKCDFTMIFDVISDSCKCPINQVRDSTGHCVCDANTFFSGGVCVKCPEKSFRHAVGSGSNDSCTCTEQYMIFNKTKMSCECTNKYIYFNENCIECPAGATKLNQTFCSCQSGKYYDPSTNQCKCFNTVFDTITQTCNTCPIDSTFVADFNTCKCTASNKIFHNNLCQCAENFYLNNSICIPCPANSMRLLTHRQEECLCLDSSISIKFDQQAGKCVCQDYYMNVSGLCIKCPFQSNLSVNGDPCVCPQANMFFDKQSFTCLCVDNFYVQDQLLTQKTCVACNSYSYRPTGMPENSCICTVTNAVFDGWLNQCKCIANFINISNQCVACPNMATSQQYDDFCTCPPNMFYIKSNNTCQCIENYYIKSGVCTRCGDNSYRYAANDTRGCICKDPMMTFDSKNNKCLCPNNKIKLNGVCQQCPGYGNGITCSCTKPNQIFLNNKCECDQDHINISNLCVKCPDNSARTLLQQYCVCSLPNQFYNYNKNTCDCPLNMFKNTISSQCQNCPAGSLRIQNESVCRCQSTLQYYDSTNNVCKCYNNAIKIGGGCFTCPLDAVVNAAGDNCECIDSHAEFNQNSFKCSCKDGYFYDQLSSTCIQCPLNSQRIGIQQKCSCTATHTFYNETAQQCSCVENYYAKNSLCIECSAGSLRVAGMPTCTCQMANAIFDDLTNECQCVSGYVKLSNTCVKCPEDSLSDTVGATCQCLDSDKQFDVNKFKCICAAGHYVQQDVCMRCPGSLSATQDQKSCQCENDYEEFDKQAGYCKCAPNYVQTASGCTRCPTYSRRTVDETFCSCIPPFKQQLVNNTCICEDNHYYNPVEQKCLTCPQTAQYVNGSCDCGDSSLFYNVSSKNCECSLFYYLANSKCVQCPPGIMQSANKSWCDCSLNKTTQASFDGAQCLCDDTQFDYLSSPLCDIAYQRQFKADSGVLSGSIIALLIGGVLMGIGLFYAIKSGKESKNNKVSRKPNNYANKQNEQITIDQNNIIQEAQSWFVNSRGVSKNSNQQTGNYVRGKQFQDRGLKLD